MVLVERLKPHMSYLISPYQTGFVSRRAIQERIIIATKVMHNMTKKKGKKSFFAIKIYLSTTYNKINWEFIWRTLIEIDILNNMINLTMHGVTSVDSNINWNRSRGGFL